MPLPVHAVSRELASLRPPRRRRPSFAVRAALATLALGAALAAATGASAQSSDLHATVSTTYVPAIQQAFTNVPSASLFTTVANDVHGNNAVANGTLSTPTGIFLLMPQAMSRGGPGLGGQANASAAAGIVRDYLVVSSTLAPGTPVSVSVRWAVNSRVSALGSMMVGSNTNATASASAHVAIYPNYVITVNRAGSLSRSLNTSGLQVIRSGALGVEAESGNHLFTLNVGQAVRLSISAELGTASSVEAGSTDGDAQFVAVWGASSLNPAASLVLVGNPSEPAPPASQGTPENALALLPPRPVGLLPCFDITTQPDSVSLCGPGNASFSTAAAGSGPFTYRWRRNGVPMDTDLYPTSTETTLLLANAGSGDAGSYDCVITSPCGDITTRAVALQVCTLSSESSPARTGTRLSAPRPAPFQASTRLSFDLATAGEATLEVFDLRGARVRTLASGWHEAGHGEVEWAGDDEAGRRAPAGVYLVRLRTAGFTGTQRVVKTN